MTGPDDALQRARAAAAEGRARGDYDEAKPSLESAPVDPVSTDRMIEWSLIEPDIERVYSTRRLGGPITFVKRLMIRGMRQYLSEGHAQQSRYNAQATSHILDLEKRVRELEDELRKNVIVHQLLCAAGPVDAVTNQGFAWRRRFDEWGWGGGDFAEVVAPGMDRAQMRPLKDFKPSAGAPVLVHYSGYARALERLVAPPSRFLVLSHNITPARFFWELEPLEGVRCSLGPSQLARIALRADVAAGVSAFNAGELAAAGVADPDVIPILFDRSKLGPAGPDPDGPPTILFVGRLAPHKRQDLVIRAFGFYRRLHAPDARLVLVGVPITPDYEGKLRRLADEVAPGAVTFANGIPAAELHDHFRAAHAFLCLSEHEGFCIPLLEAFHFGVPVIARAVGGVTEVVADAGMLLADGDDLAVVAELLHVAVSDPSLRATLRPRAEARLAHYAAEKVARQMRSRLEELAA